MQTPTPLTALRTQLAAMDVDGMIVPRADAYQSEDCAPHDNKLAWLTGFSGSAGPGADVCRRTLPGAGSPGGRSQRI